MGFRVMWVETWTDRQTDILVIIFCTPSASEVWHCWESDTYNELTYGSINSAKENGSLRGRRHLTRMPHHQRAYTVQIKSSSSSSSWLVLRWMLPFLQACSMLVDSVLSDRQLPDQYWVVSDLIRWSGARCGMVGPIGSSSPLAEETQWPEGLGSGPWKDWCEQCGQRTSDESYGWCVWVVAGQCGYLFAARCKWFAYGPADSTATRSSLASLKSRMVLPFWYQLNQAALKNKPLNDEIFEVQYINTLTV